jgi:hypothetical protein
MNDAKSLGHPLDQQTVWETARVALPALLAHLSEARKAAAHAEGADSAPR